MFWKDGMMLRIGLTGGIGSGKSTVSAMMKKIGIEVIEADIIAREVLDIYPEIKENIKDSFGVHFFDLDGNLLRKKMGDFIFHYTNERVKLENLIIPYIKKEITERFIELEKKGTKLCVLDAPTLIEQGLHENMDINILVWVDKNIQVQRLKLRDKLSDQQIIDRINAQMSLEEKRDYVDFVIDNRYSLLDTKKQVENILAVL
jgi:dephospho-CoA kinase